jgi:hypothetical protein
MEFCERQYFRFQAGAVRQALRCRPASGRSAIFKSYFFAQLIWTPSHGTKTIRHPQAQQKAFVEGIKKMHLLFLLRLQHVELPAEIVRPEEIKHVSVLKATGLVEAEIAPAIDASGKFNMARTAIVTAITADGIAEITKLRTERMRPAATWRAARRRRRVERAAATEPHRKQCMRCGVPYQPNAPVCSCCLAPEPESSTPS